MRATGNKFNKHIDSAALLQHLGLPEVQTRSLGTDTADNISMGASSQQEDLTPDLDNSPTRTIKKGYRDISPLAQPQLMQDIHVYFETKKGGPSREQSPTMDNEF